MDFSGIVEKLKEQEWYQQIQASYQQLPSDQQNYVKWGLLGGGILVWALVIFSLAGAAGSLRREYQDKQALVRMVTDASDELRRLRGQSTSLSAGTGEQGWKNILASMVTAQGLAPDSLEVLQEAPGASENVIQETLLEFRIKNISIRALVQILTQIHQGSPPMKLKGLLVEAENPEGLLNAKLNVSGYLAKGEKPK